MSLKYAWLEAKKSRKKWWIAGAALGILLLAIYIFASINYWQGYEARAEARHQQIKDQTKKALTLNVGNQVDKNKKLAALQGVHQAIEKHKDSCEVDVWFSWQRHLPVAKMKLEQCETKLKRVVQFNTVLSRLVEYMKSEQSLSTIILENIKTTDSIAESEMMQLSQQWDAVIKKIDSQSVTSDFNTTKADALRKTRDVYTAWQNLIDASTRKDRTKYEQAVTQLGVAYGAFEQLAQTNEQQLRIIATELERAFGALQ